MTACIRRGASPLLVLAFVPGFLAGFGATSALAQDVPPVEVVLSLNAGLTRPATTNVSIETEVVDPPDRDTATTSFALGGRPSFDLGIGILVRRRFFVGVAASRFSDTPAGTLTYVAEHPRYHPTLTADGPAGDLARSERRVDLQFGYAMPVSRTVTVTLFGGPSHFGVSQGLVADFDLGERVDPVTRTFSLVGPSDIEVDKVTGSGWGYNVGADATVMLSRHVGVGGLVRYSRGTVDLRDPLESLVKEREITKPFTAGGVQMSGGIRFRF